MNGKGPMQLMRFVGTAVERIDNVHGFRVDEGIVYYNRLSDTGRWLPQAMPLKDLAGACCP